MCSNVKLFLYTFDFIGMVPQFRILKNDSYKSIFSSIISIIITIASIVFSIYSIIDYLKFNNPTISYLKRYDNALNNTIFLKDTLFMFKVYNMFMYNFRQRFTIIMIPVSFYSMRCFRNCGIYVDTYKNLRCFLF